MLEMKFSSVAEEIRLFMGNLCRKVILMNKCTMIIRNTFVLIAFALAGLSTHAWAGLDRYLLLDSRIIESTNNAKLSIGAVRKDKNNTLFKEDKPSEPRFDNTYVSILGWFPLMTGAVDDVMIFTKTLTPDQITQIYQGYQGYGPCSQCRAMIAKSSMLTH